MEKHGVRYDVLKRVRCSVVGIFLSSLAVGGLPAMAEDKSDLEMYESERQGNIEEILDTLNDALVENQELRENMIALQDGFEKITVENNVLKSQMRKLEKEKILWADAQNNLDTLRDEMDGKINALSDEKHQLTVQLEETKQEKTEKEKEIKRLNTVLDKAILEEERDDYRRMITEADENSRALIDHLSQVNTENEQLKTELADMHYQVGNVMFENKNYHGAIKQFKKALDWNPAHFYAHHNLAVIYDYYVDDHPQAIHHYERYLDLKPLAEEASEVRERVLQLGLFRKVVPSYPLKMDFNEYHRSNGK